MFDKPVKAFLTSGSAESRYRLTAFDAALIEAGVGNTNLLEVSSIVPEGCRIVESWEVGDGELVPSVVAKDVGSGLVEAAVAVVSSKSVGVVAEADGKGAEKKAVALGKKMVEKRGLSVEKIFTACSSIVAKEVGAAVALVCFHQEGK